jgi:hypothetical protein
VEIFHAATAWLNNGEFPSQVMNTNIMLISKKDNPETMRDLWPISLCNVIYKIISKVLANRLKPLLQKCISHEQSAFVENRSIIDNVMAAHEIIHHMKCKRRGKVGEVALKIDISKSYDRVEWEYVTKFICRFGFHDRWEWKVLGNAFNDRSKQKSYVWLFEGQGMEEDTTMVWKTSIKSWAQSSY